MLDIRKGPRLIHRIGAFANRAVRCCAWIQDQVSVDFVAEYLFGKDRGPRFSFPRLWW